MKEPDPLEHERNAFWQELDRAGVDCIAFIYLVVQLGVWVT